MQQHFKKERKLMSKHVFGIDLGTTYSCIAYINENGQPQVIQNLEGSNTTPSVVNFASPDEVVVGQVAKDTAVLEPENTVQLVKTLMGKTDFAIYYNGEDKTPEEVSAYILKKVAQDASEQLGEEVKDVVITCPAYFGTAERTATKNAGEIAGLNVIKIVNEPTAAAVYYGCTKETEPKTILVFDLGGGTFDVTVMRIDEAEIKVICSDGNHELGGRDWDEVLMSYMRAEFQKKHNVEFDEYAEQDLRIKAEQKKIQLTQRTPVPVMIEAGGERERIEITREAFDTMTESLLNQALEKTDSAISIAKSKGFTIDEIILVGGSTRMPQVKTALIERYGMEPRFMEPDEAVAKGAAICAALEYKEIMDDSDNNAGVKEASSNVQELFLPGTKRDVIAATTKSFAVEAYGKDNILKCFNMIFKNELMRDGVITAEETFRTRHDNQKTVEIKVYETDFMEESFDVDEDYVLGSVVLELGGDQPQGAPIAIRLSLNSEGILDVTGIDKITGKEIHTTMHAKGIMAKEKVDEIKEKATAITVS